MTRVATSAPTPKLCGASCTTIRRPVRRTDSSTVGMSSGDIDRRSPQPRTAEELGLHAGVQRLQDGVVRVTLRARALIDGARVHAAGFTPSDDAFCVEPGRPRAIDLIPSQNDAVFGAATVRALNLTTPLTATPPR